MGISQKSVLIEISQISEKKVYENLIKLSKPLIYQNDYLFSIFYVENLIPFFGNIHIRRYR